jgi:signal transduction histidine kinase
LADDRRRQERRRDVRERTRLMEQLIAAEQDERRRLADFLHDTSVQSLSAIALMLDAGLHAIDARKLDDARGAVMRAAEHLRGTIRELRDLSFKLEPVVLRDQGLGPALRELTSQVGMEERMRIDVDVAAADALAKPVQAVLYQIIRESLEAAVRRGPPTRINVRVRESDDRGVETVISDDAPGERRRAVVDALEERARMLGGSLEVDSAPQAGTVVRVMLPASAVRAEPAAV